MRSRASPLALVVALALLGIAAAPPAAPPAPAASAAADEAKLENDVRTALGTAMATALTAQMRLAQALQQDGQQQDSLRRSLQTIGARLAELDRSIVARQGQIDVYRARVVTERAALGALARALYRQPSSLLERLAGSGSLEGALTTGGDLDAAGRRGGQLEAGLVHDLDTLQAAQDQERAERQRQADVQAAQQRLVSGLAQLAQQEQQTAVTLAATMQRIRSELATAGTRPAGVALRVGKELLAEVTQSSAAAAQEVWSQALLALQVDPAALALASSGAGAGSPLVWPLPHAVISQPFGPTDFELEPSYAGFAHFHTGIDLVEPAGSPVLAAAAGIVAVVGSGTTGYGNYVIVAHAAGLSTLYGHLAIALVAAGQAVAQGQPLGLEGSTGNSTGPHCHFEVRVDGQPVDPMPFLPSASP